MPSHQYGFTQIPVKAILFILANHTGLLVCVDYVHTFSIMFHTPTARFASVTSNDRLYDIESIHIRLRIDLYIFFTYTDKSKGYFDVISFSWMR